MLRPLCLFALLGAVLVLSGPAAADEVRLYAFGNSLVNHPTDGEETNLPVWLNRLAQADGNSLRLDGHWGFLRDFARDLPPAAVWSFPALRGAWNPEGGSFGAAEFDAVLIAPANFLQHQPPDAPYDDAADTGTTPLTATLAVIDWLAAESPGTRVLLYEGWPDMAPFFTGFPPRPAAMAKYHAWTLGGYHQWYLDWLEATRVARPEARLDLIPVAEVLARLLTETDLAVLPPDALYLDDAPHGTPTLYLMAAMVLYEPLYGTPLPEGFAPPEGIHPLLRSHYAETAAFVHAALSGQVPPVPAPKAGPAVWPARDIPPPSRLPVLHLRNGTGLEDPALAMGLNGISDWSAEQPFVDIMKTSRPWIGHSAGEWGAFDAETLRAGGYVNEDGWPVALPEGATALETFILTDLPEGARRMAGRYRVTWIGSGTLRITGRASRVSIREAEHTAWFGFSPGEGPVGIAIEATDPGDPIRDIVVVREAHIPLWEAGVLFNPDWVDVVHDLRGVRFMDWMQTNASPVQTWDDRPRVTDATWTRGVPVEVMVALANQIGADPWFNMPHMADDDYARRFAQYVHAKLDPRLVVWVEYSNELWNFQFPQAVWAGEQARARWGTEAGDDAWMQFAGMRAAQVAAIWAEVFADAPERLKRVIAVHTGWPGLEEPLLQAPLWRAGTPGTPAPGAPFDAYAVSGYFGYDLGSDENAAIMHDLAAMGPDGHDAAARLLRDRSLAELLDELWPYHAAAAAHYGLELVMYEGGSHVVGQGAQADDPVLADFFTGLNYAPQMATLYDELLTGWRAAGGTLFNAFVDVATPTRFGAWGALRHLDDDNPRWGVLAAYNTGGGGWEIRAPGTFRDGVRLVGGDGPETLLGTGEEDILIGGAGNDVLAGNGGADHLNGGPGHDVAVLPGRPGDYRLSRDRAGRVIADSAFGVVTIFAVEVLQFADAPGEVVDLDDLP